MARQKYSRLFFILFRWLVAAIFIIAGIGKIINPVGFSEDIDNYRILPYLLVTILAIILPWVEISCGLLLLIGKFQKGAAFALLILSVIFFIAISSALVRGLDINCGCFGVDSEATRVSITRMIEDMFLIGLLLLVYRQLLQENSRTS